jgi:hypothetical protein
LHRLLFLWHGRLLRRGCLPPTQVLLGHASSSHVRYGTESAARRNRQGSSSRALSRESPWVDPANPGSVPKTCPHGVGCSPVAAVTAAARCEVIFNGSGP